MRIKYVLSVILAFAWVFAIAPAWADTHYVCPVNPGAAAPYTNWAQASTNIQSAVDEAVDGDVVMLTNGTYDAWAEIEISKTVTVTSVNGAEETIVDGGFPSRTNRCFSLYSAGAVLDGLTIRRGGTADQGGGVMCDPGVVQNCVITENSAENNGGGITCYRSESLVLNCLITRNCATNGTNNRAGGGVALSEGAIARGCLIVSNMARFGGGIFLMMNGGSLADNCTISYNDASDNGGGVNMDNSSVLRNTIIYFNTTPNPSEWDDIAADGGVYMGVFTNCCAPVVLANGTNNITNNPLFTATFQLAAGSACIDRGTNQPWMAGAFDLAGNDRIINTNVDIGAYEYKPAAKANQTITFAPIAPQKQSASVGLSATASSALSVSFSVITGPGSLSGETNLSFSGVGEVEVVASQAGDDNYNAAPDVTNSISVFSMTTEVGPFAGGNSITITNGNFGIITNVLVGGVKATIQSSGANWVTITIPAIGSAGVKDIVIQTDTGDVTLTGAYTVNPAGEIGLWDWSRWEQVAALPAPRRNLAVGVLNGAMYSCGGEAYSGAQTNVYRYDGMNWAEVAGLPAARIYPAVGVLNGMLYSVGGFSGGNRTNVYRYNGTSWGETAGLPATRYAMGVGVLHGALYAVGGDSGGARTNMYRFDGTNWVEVAGLPAGLYSLSAGVLSGAMYVVGGSDGTSARTNVYRYDGVSWMEVPGLPAARHGLSAGVLNGALYAIGGSDGTTTRTNVYRYDGVSWMEVPGLPAARANLSPGAGVLNGSVYSVGGSGSGVSQANVYRYPAVVGSGVSPASGSWTGGYTVVISGSNLCDGSDITNVTLCGVAATILPGQSATQVVVVAGAGGPGLGDVRVFSTSFGETVKSNAFTYIGSGIAVQGTAFGPVKAGDSVAHTFSITNSGNAVLNISGWTTGGVSSSRFQVSNLPATVSVGGVSNFTVTFSPDAAGSFTAQLDIENDSPVATYTLSLSGSGYQLSTDIGPYAGGNTITITNGNFGNVTNVLVGGVKATIQSSGANWATITIPATGSAGTKDIVIQTDTGDITLAGAYTVNPAGAIGLDWLRWQEVAGLPAARSSPASGVLNGALYVAGGHDGSARTNAYRYDGTNWSEVAGLPASRYEVAGGVLNGALYVVGGRDATTVARTNVYRYDGTTWTEVAGLPAARYAHAVTMLNDALYVVDGRDAGGAARTNVYRYNGTNWSEVAGLPVSRYAPAAAVLNGDLYALGGENSGARTNAYRYNGTNWTEVAGLPSNRFYQGAGVMDGALYAFGGSDGTLTATNTYRFDGTNWTEAARLPAPRYAVAAGVLNGELYAVGGVETSTSKTNVYRYPAVAGSGVNPTSGSWTGVYEVVIGGWYLGDGSDITNVTICGVAATILPGQSATQVVVVAGVSAAAGLGDVRVFSTSFGVTVASNSFTYLRESQAPLVFAPASPQAYGTTNTLSVSGGSGTGAVSYTVLSGPGLIVDGTKLTATNGSGTISIRATKAQDDVYYEASVTASVEAAKAGQTITFAPIAPQKPDASVGLSAIASSGLLVSFGVISGPGSLSDTNLTFAGVGDVEVVASQVGDGNWNAAPEITNIVRVFSMTTEVGPFAGGNSITITNGGFGTITNVLVGGVKATIQSSGANWVTITIPAAGSAGVKDIVIQTDTGDITLAGAYTVNPAGEIGGFVADWTRWEEVAGLPAERSAPAVGVLNGVLYAFGGSWSSGYATNMYRYAGGSWSEVVGLPSARAGLGAGEMNESLFAVGGRDGSSLYGTNLYQYNGTNWAEVVGLPDGHRNLSAGVLNGALYAIGGSSSSSLYSTNVYRYNGTNWAEVAGLPDGRRNLAVEVLNGAMYVVGGDNAGAKTNVFRYSGTNWTEVVGLPVPRRSLAAGVMNGVMYVVGGDISGTVQTNMYRYDGSIWSEVAGLPAARTFLAVEVLNETLYAVGGSDGITARTNVYRYPSRTEYVGVSPVSGSWTGGYQVVITGTNLCDGSDITNVTLCGMAATILPGQSATQVTVVAGAGGPGLGDVRVFSTSFGETVKSNAFTYLRETQAPLVFTLASPQTYNTASALSTSGGSGTGAVSYAVTAGPGFIMGNAIMAVFSGTGDVVVVATKAADDLYFAISATATVACAKANQTVIFPAIVDQLTTNKVGLAATASSGLFASFGVISGPASVDGTNLSFTGAGMVSIAASQAGDGNYNPAPNVTNTFNVTKALASVTLTNLTQTYDGTARVVGFASVPSVSSVLFTYDGNGWAPTNAGSYAITGTVDDVMYQGSQTGTLTVARGLDSIIFGNTNQVYDGTAKTVTVASAQGQAVSVTYDGSATAPVNAGVYTVTGVVDAANWEGTNTTTLTIAKADQTISDFLPTNGSVFVETNTVGLSATASSGLFASFSVISGPASVDGTNLSFTGAGMVSIAASQAGDGNYNAAPDVTNTFTVLAVFDLTIQSAHGTATPATGTYSYVIGTVITNIVVNPGVSGTTQYVCAGWAMVGNSPTTGTTKKVVMTITNDATLTWLWTTYYWLHSEAESHGWVNIGDGWQKSGQSVLITPTAAQYYHFANWTGDAEGDADPLDLLMDAPKWVTANFAQNMTTNSPVPVPEEWLAGYGLTNFEEDANADPDHDGQKTWEEYLAAMTDPTNPASFFRTRVGQGNVLISWPSASGRLYNVEATLNVRGYDWTPTEWINQTGTPPLNTITNPASAITNAVQFFRAKARME